MSAYTEMYLSEAMYNMAEMLHYVDTSCNLDPERFLKMFRISGMACQWEKGNPVFLLGRSGTEMAMEILDSCHYRIYENSNGEYSAPKLDLHPGAVYWAGWILAYYQWSRDESFNSIFRELSFKDLLAVYPAGHTASEERACELIDQRRKNRQQVERLQTYRLAIGMTQSELAQKSGVNLRTLQEYETGRKRLELASAAKVIKLANVLQVPVRELIN